MVMTESLKRLPVAGKGEAPEPGRQRSEDAAAPPRAARKIRRDANGCMGHSLLSVIWTIPGWYHFHPHDQRAAGLQSEECDKKRVPRPFASFSPAHVLYGEGITACSQAVLRTLTCLSPAS